MTSSKQGVIEGPSVLGLPLEGEPWFQGSPSNSLSFLLPLPVGGHDHE